MSLVKNKNNNNEEILAGKRCKYCWLQFEAGATFDNSFFDNYFDFLRQLKNGSFLDPVFVHVTGRSQN